MILSSAQGRQAPTLREQEVRSSNLRAPTIPFSELATVARSSLAACPHECPHGTQFRAAFAARGPCGAKIIRTSIFSRTWGGFRYAILALYVALFWSYPKPRSPRFSATRLLTDLAHLATLSFRSRSALVAENLFLRKQLALYQEREVKPHRAVDATRLFLVVLSKVFDWRSALVIVKPDTLIRWHRKGFRLFWRWKSRTRGRPKLLRALIQTMAAGNPIWGEARIADELLLKLGTERVTTHHWKVPSGSACRSYARSGPALAHVRPKPRSSCRGV